MRKLITIGIAAVAVLLSTPANAKPPLEAFGDAPTIRSAQLSPDGKIVAFINRLNGVDYLAKYDMETGKNEALIKIPDIKAGGIGFAGPNYIILHASKIVADVHVCSKYEDTAAFAYNLKTKQIVQLLVGTIGLYPYQSGLGHIVGIDPNGAYAYMPAYADHPGSEPSLDLFKVSLDTGRGARVAGRDGTSTTIGWVMDDKGNVVAREDYNNKTDVHEIRAYDASGNRVI